MRSHLKLLVAVLATAVVLSVPATAWASVSLTTKEKAVVAAVNKIRAARGLTKLSVKTTLVRAARSHAAEMGTAGYFAHESADGEPFSTRIIRHGYKRAGYSFWKVGEDIAWATNGLYSCPEVIVDNWMHSPGHRAVILTKAFRNIGIGVKSCDGYGGCNGKVWFYTLDLGRRIR